MSLSSPCALVYDGIGHLYVGQSYPAIANVVKISVEGMVVTNFTFSPAVDYPLGLSVDLSGDLYVGDMLAERVVKFAPNGTQLQIFSTVNPPLFYPSGHGS